MNANSFVKLLIILFFNISGVAQQITVEDFVKKSDVKPAIGTRGSLKNTKVAPVNKHIRAIPCIDNNVLRLSIENKVSFVRVTRINLLGRAIGPLFEGFLEKGRHDLDLSTYKTAARVYFLSVNINGKETFLKVMPGITLVLVAKSPLAMRQYENSEFCDKFYSIDNHSDKGA